MAKSKGYIPPTYTAKNFNLDDINKGIKKLERRKTEIQGLVSARHDDQAIDNAVSNLVMTISEVFGDQSKELDENRYHNIWKGPVYIGMDDHEKQSSFAAGIPDTLKLVDGLIQRLQEKQLDLSEDDGPRATALLNGLPIHERIYKASHKLFQDGHYANAAFEASKALVSMVKEKSGRVDKDGSALMFAELTGKEPGLLFNPFITQSEMDEQSGLGYLFAGAVLAIRNPRGHESMIDSSEEALEYIVFISMLAKKMDKAQKRIK